MWFYLDYLMFCFKDYKEKIGIYVGLKRVINYSLKVFEKYRFMVIIGEVGSGKMCFGFELMFWM